jgi:hypothetical protein
MFVDQQCRDVLVSRIMKEIGDIDDTSFEDWLVRRNTNDERLKRWSHYDGR